MRGETFMCDYGERINLISKINVVFLKEIKMENHRTFSKGFSTKKKRKKNPALLILFGTSLIY